MPVNYNNPLDYHRINGVDVEYICPLCDLKMSLYDLIIADYEVFMAGVCPSCGYSADIVEFEIEESEE